MFYILPTQHFDTMHDKNVFLVTNHNYIAKLTSTLFNITFSP